MINVNLVASVIILLIASICDIKTKKIPNWITLPSIVCGLVLAIITQDEPISKIVMLTAFFLFGAIGLIGLGDIKLLMALYMWNSGMVASLAFLVAAIMIIITGEIMQKGNTQRGLSFVSVACITRRVPTCTGKSIAFAPFLFAGYIMTKGVMVICFA